MVQLTRADMDAVPLLLTMMTDFYAHFGYPFDEAAKQAALAPLLNADGPGWVWLIGPPDAPQGYAVMTRGYSLERGGPIALLDELYLVPTTRGQGLGAQVLEAAADACAHLGIGALLLEVERDNPAARQLYERAGFAALDRDLMVRTL